MLITSIVMMVSWVYAYVKTFESTAYVKYILKERSFPTDMQ